MSRTPFGTPFRRRPERFPDQTRPDQSCFTSASGPSITPHSFVAVCSGGASSIEMNEVGSK